MLSRTIVFIYGFTVYAFMFVTFLYFLGFIANFLVPKGIDSGPDTPLAMAMVIDIALIAVFCIPHSIMARPRFKSWWTGIIPKTIERSTYVLIATLFLILMFWQWRPMTQIIWQVEQGWAQATLWGLYIFGIVLFFAATFIIDHFDLFGLKQVTVNLMKKTYIPPSFKVTYLYKFIRQPLYIGWFLIFWATPTMTLGHLVFAIGMSTYILIAIRYEEEDLARFHGEDYVRYKERVPKFIPKLGEVHETIRAKSSGQSG